MNKTKLKYDITKNAARRCPNWEGTECVQLLLSGIKDMHEPLFRCSSLFLERRSAVGISVSRPQLEGIMWHDGQWTLLILAAIKDNWET